MTDRVLAGEAGVHDATNAIPNRGARPAGSRANAWRPFILILILCGLCLLAAPSAQAAFPGENGLIAFSSGSQIYTMNPDGTGRVPLTATETANTDPTFSADGSKIAFSSGRDGGSREEIYSMSANGSGQTRLTTSAAVTLNDSAAFDRNGRRIAFASDRDGNYEVYIMNANGSGQTRLTTSPSFDGAPAFSPDGTKIAFTSRRGGTFDLYTMNPDGTNQTLLVTNAIEPTFSPDGSKIAFARSSDGEIYTMNANGTGQQVNLTKNVAADRKPAFSPDGSQIAFTRDTAANVFDVYTMNADGTGQMNRSLFTGDAPDWGPKAATAPTPSYELTVSRSGSGQGTVTSSPAGINCGSDCKETYTLDTQVTLTPTPSGGGQFSGWTGDCTGTGTCTVKMDRARFVTATFAAAATPPSASIGDVTVTEGNSGTVNANFTVTLAFASKSPVTVGYATADDSAKAPEDYEPQGAGTLTFAANETTKTLTVPVKGDTADEPDERFFVDLANPTGDPAARTRGSATITDDDGPPTISIDDVSVAEGNAGKTDANFKISLSERSGYPVAVDLATADGTAKASSDYDPAAGTATFAPGETEKTLTVKVIGDTLVEPDETFFVNLSAPVKATIADAQGRGTIRDDDTTVNASADLSLTATDAPDPATVGSDLTYTLTVANAGPSAAANATVTDDLPASASFVSASASQGSCSRTGQQVSCPLGSLAKDAGATVTIVVRPTTAGPLSNTAAVQSATPDPRAANNSATATTQVDPAAGTGDGGTNGGGPVVGAPTSNAGPLTPPAGPLAPALTPPAGPLAPAVVAVSEQGISPKRFAPAPSGPSALAAKAKRKPKSTGAKVSYRLNMAASVRFTVSQARAGRKQGKGRNVRCVARTKKNRKAKACKRTVTLPGSFILSGKAGPNSFRFTGRLANKKLRRGSYTLTATPTAQGKTGKPASMSFTVTR